VTNQVVAKVLGKDVTRGALTLAFNRVCDIFNWKRPIDQVIELNDAEMALIREAIIFFTGSVPTFTPMLGGKLPKCRYRVTAAGYYAAVGA
jgi:hypothetical protein